MPNVSTSIRSSRWRIVLLDARDFIVSLKLTIVLLGFSMVLVFAGTIDQVNLGIWAVQEKYFRSFAVFTQVGGVAMPVFPGGYTIGGLLLANLIAAHVDRFVFSWRKSGILLTHLGLIVLLVGELLTGLWQQEFHVRISEGETRSYAESFREYELVVIDATDATIDDVIAIPEALVAGKRSLQHPKLPFRITPKSYYPNSSLHLRPATAGGAGAEGAPETTAGVGGHIVAAPQPLTHRSDEHNIPSTVIEIAGADGTLGTYLVSGYLPKDQSFNHAGRTWKIGLRLKRAYQPFSLTLIKFSHDRYAGTEIPKNFSSRIRLTTAEGQEDREVLISMNNPLRYGGLAFYQAGFENDDRTTVLQVVQNPSWLVPYIACGMMTAGLAVQFGVHLFGFVWRRRRVVVPAIAPPKAIVSSGRQPASQIA